MTLNIQCCGATAGPHNGMPPHLQINPSPFLSPRVPGNLSPSWICHPRLLTDRPRQLIQATRVCFLPRIPLPPGCQESFHQMDVSFLPPTDR